MCFISKTFINKVELIYLFHQQFHYVHFSMKIINTLFPSFLKINTCNKKQQKLNYYIDLVFLKNI